MKKNLHDYAYPAADPSLLAANKEKMKEEILYAEKCGARFIHIDVMDGKFVPATSLGLDFVKKYSFVHHMVNDVHLMIEEPWKYVGEYVKAGADIVTFHIEACPNEEKIRETIEKVIDDGANVGISIKPNTPVSILKPYIKDIDVVLLMSVEPGKGGQKFLSSSLDRLDEINELLKDLEPSKRPLLAIDGGINENTSKEALNHGAQLLIAGSYLYGHDDFKDRLRTLENSKGNSK